MERYIVNEYNPFRYRGYYYDVETGYYYLQSRYYNPNWGRFLNADGYVSTGQGLLGNNMFLYCNNNPVMGCDPCGTCIHRWDFWNNCTNCEGKTIIDVLSDGLTALQETFAVVMEEATDFMRNAVDSITVDVGFGGGFEAQMKAGGISGTLLTRADIITIQKDSGKDSQFYVGYAVEQYGSMEGLHFVFERGTKEFYDFSGECIKRESLQPHFDPTISFGSSAYFVMGYTISIGFDVEYFLSQYGITFD